MTDQEAIQYVQDTFGDAWALYYNAEHKLLVKRAEISIKYPNVDPDVVVAICNILKFEFGGFYHLKINDIDTETTPFFAYVGMNKL